MAKINLGVGTLAVLLAAAACSTDGGADPTPSASASTDLGRVVVLAEEALLADVLALGIEPVASSATVAEAGFQGLDAYATAGIQVLPMTTLDLEQLAALQPDIIVTLQFWADQVGEETLAGLADLVVVPDGLTTPERVTELGRQLHRESEAAALVDELAAATAAAQAQVPDDCRVSVAAIYPGPTVAAFVDGPWDLPSAVLATGCALDPDTAAGQADANGRLWLSTEQLNLLDAPLIVLLQSDTVEGERAAVTAISSDPLWANLPAVQAGAVHEFDRLGYPGIEGQLRFLQEFAALTA